ncbi:hypothetical protein CAP35_13785 [Chitinophagaceae bacterium IBVUCB1]|nr:hypothetical protein CAP35_13785 [Chitinophagaceae bacterium IBVUCB1]
MPEVKKHVYTREVERGLSTAENVSFLEGLPDRSQFVQSGDEAETIHSTYFGVEPDVLIDNTAYPIAIQQLDGEDFTVTLKKYQTKQTPVSDDELYAATYDKMGVVRDTHVSAINKKKFARAIHSLAPADNQADTPVLMTTGSDDGTGRRMLTMNDIVNLKRACDKLEWEADRRLVLCPDHVNDLLLVDQKFKEQYYNYTTGKIANLYGFEVYEYVKNPHYVVATKVKKSFGAVPTEGPDRQASVCFVKSRTVKATGSTKMYWAKAETDPEYQRNRMNFRHYHIVVPSAKKCIAAIVSDNAA